jgi:hypothetical protein
MRPLVRRAALVACMAATASCGGGSDAPPAGAAAAPPYREVDMVSPRHDDAVMGQAGWNHAQSATADLDGDGTPERAVIIANADTYHGTVLWNDGQVWEVYVEEPDGTRTYVYKQFLQLGSVLARLARPEAARPAQAGQQTPPPPPTILLLEQVPQRFSAYEVRYAGPGQAKVVELMHRDYDLRSLFQGTPDP